jgi:hypothetical protein
MSLFASSFRYRALLAGLALLLLAACDSYKDDIAAVQAAESVVGSNQELVEELAGAKGTYDWKAQPYVEGKKEIVLVEARIETIDNRGGDHVIQLLWVHNRQSGKVAAEDIIVDGRSRGLVQGAMDLMLLQIE